MRPDRIIVGEVRGAETLDMLQAMNTGHEGSLSTIHANSPRDSLSRLETMVLMAGFELPVKAIRQQISSALDLIVQLDRLDDGTRHVTEITEVQRMEGDAITLQKLFEYHVERVEADRKVVGHLLPTGLRPTFLPKFAQHGIELPADTFGTPLDAAYGANPHQNGWYSGGEGR
jgi:pilus assembly protein CpaF